MPVELSHDSFGTIVLETRDIADGGVYIKVAMAENQLVIDDVIAIMLRGFMGESPREVEARVVRVDKAGFAIEFMQNPFADS